MTSAATSAEREAEIRKLAETNGRRLMGDGHYSVVCLGWADIHLLLDEIDRLRAWKEARIESHPTDTEFYGR